MLNVKVSTALGSSTSAAALTFTFSIYYSTFYIL